MPEIQYPKNPNSDTAFVVQEDGTKNRALMTAPQDTSTLELPSNPNSTKGYVTIDGKKQRVILTADIGGGGGSSLPDQTGHSGEFLTTDGTDASWTAVDALPDQTGQSGKFLTTDGTDASWSDKPLVNTSTEASGLTILGTATTGAGSINVGKNSVASGAFNTAIGYNAQVYANHNTALGNSAGVSGSGHAYCVAIGYGATVKATHAIQLGGSLQTNSDANTFKVANANGNFEIMSADGTIPADRLIHAINKYSTMPTASASNEGWIVQYTGTTDSTYTHGHLYECVSDGADPATYSWTEVSMGGGSSYTAGTGIDITSGVISVTAPTLVNNATGSNSAGILSRNIIATDTVAVGTGQGTVSGNDSVALGVSASAQSLGVVAVGRASNAVGNNSIAIGKYAGTTAAGAIQISSKGSPIGASNSDANTMKVANANGNFEIMSADGTVPTARLTKVNTTATLAVADWSSSTQTVTVSGVKADSVVFVSPAPASASDYASAGILCTAQAADSLTFTCTTTPTNAITVNIVCM